MGEPADFSVSTKATASAEALQPYDQLVGEGDIASRIQDKDFHAVGLRCLPGHLCPHDMEKASDPT